MELLRLAAVPVAAHLDLHSVLADSVWQCWDSEVQSLVGKVTGSLV